MRTGSRTSFALRSALARTPYERARHFLEDTIWQIDLRSLDKWRRIGVMGLRVLYLTGRGFVSSRAQLQASSLTYVTMLALVPALAVVFALFQSFGGLAGTQQRVQSFLVEQIAATPDQAKMIQEWIPQLIENVQKNVQSGSGIAPIAFVLLVFTVVTLLGSIEKTLNDIWGVKRQRSIVQKFVTYWAVATLGPVLLGIALVTSSNIYARVESALSPSKLWAKLRGKEAALEAPKPKPSFHGPSGALAAEYERARPEFETPLERLEWVTTGQRPGGGSKLIGLVLVSIAFTFLYAMMPNTRVRWGPAFTGGVVAALLWQASRWGLTKGSSALVSYNTIYGSLATIPILMFWLYLSWIVVILGAELTFAIQNMRAQGREELALEASERIKEVVALRLMAAIADAFDRGARPPSLQELAERTGAPTVLCSDLLFHLCEDGYLRELELAQEERGYLPGKPIDRITLFDVVRSLRDKKGTSFALEHGPEAVFLESQLGAARASEESVAGQVTFLRVVREMRGYVAPMAMPEPVKVEPVPAPAPPASSEKPEHAPPA